jgi:type IV pilus assembly protein PilA
MSKKLHLRLHRKGFTLIELMIVISIVSLLVSVVLIAINPNTQLGKARDAERIAAVNTILDAIYQYQVDSNNMPQGIPTGTPIEICKTDAVSCNNGLDLSVLTNGGKYLARIPEDLYANTTGTGTNYWVAQIPGGRITVSAGGAEQIDISVTR